VQLSAGVVELGGKGRDLVLNTAYINAQLARAARHARAFLRAPRTSALTRSFAFALRRCARPRTHQGDAVPFTLLEGRLACARAALPWRALLTAGVVVELSGVTLRVAPRAPPDADAPAAPAPATLDALGEEARGAGAAQGACARSHPERACVSRVSRFSAAV
jgi:hypothetical protein